MERVKFKFGMHARYLELVRGGKEFIESVASGHR